LTVKPAALERQFRNMAEIFWHRVEDTPELEAYRYPVGESWKSLSWKQVGERVEAIACGLLSLGIEKEQRCGILCSTRVEWILSDLAILCAGGATTTLYPSNTAEECAYILKDSATRLVFAEDDEQIAKLRQHKDELPDLVKVITFDGTSDGEWVIGLHDLEELGRVHAGAHPDAMADIARTIEPEDLATLIYTSGTTGQPKGVRLVHDCWAYEGEAIQALGLLSLDDLQYLWLPLSHSFAKVLLAGQLCVGFPSAVDGRIPKLIDNLAVVRPTFMAAAPRIFEKVYNKVISGAKQGGGLKYKIFHWAMSTGREVSRVRQSGGEARGVRALKQKVADKLVFSKLKARFGGRIKYFISGSAPLSKEIAEFFHAADILILEGYGLTESSAASFVNRPDAYRFGTVGMPLPGTEVRIADEDGEILIRSPGIMRGYHNLPEKTAEVLDDQGWLHTGDIGELDRDGFLKITDRKKDLIKTSGGKYVAPQLIEGRFKGICPVASQIVVHGDNRNYCSALITLDEEAITAWALETGLAGRTYEELTQHDKVRGLIQGYVDELNKGLASYETIKRFVILPQDLSVEDGALTPSLKVKRKVVEKRYKDVLDTLYTGALESM
jgi:long-chain acyl-CoA synthetase